MGTVTSLVSGIETTAESFLGSTFSKIPYGIDVDLNRNRGSDKTFAVLPIGASQDQSYGRLIVDQGISFKLIDSYLPGKLNDHTIQDKTNSLFDKIYALYEKIVTEKCGQPSLVMNTFGLDISEPEYLAEEVVIIEFSFIVKHKLI